MKLSMRKALEQVRQADTWLADNNPAPFHVTARGLEAVITGGMLGMERSDWVFPGLRERVGAVLRGCPHERLVDGHAGARPYRMAPVSTSAGARLLHACGMAASPDNDGSVLCFLGQGSAATGSFHEALNIAAQQKLPVIFLCHNWNLEHPESPMPPQIAGSLTAKGLAYGLHTNAIDGGLITEVLHAVSDARSHPGPSLIEARIIPGEDPIDRAYSELTETDPATGESAIA
mgnify:CR=1 FL=1